MSLSCELVYRHYDLEPGIWFGELTLEDGGARTHDIHAVEDTLILFISRGVVLAIGEQWPELYRGLFSVLARRMRCFGLLDLSHQGVSLKACLVFRLLWLMRIYGEKTEDGIEIKIAITQSDLATLSGGSRQHINQILKKWNDQNVVRSGARVAVIDRSALEILADF